MATQDTLIQFIQNYQRSKVFFKIAGISGALAIALGAYGSHGKCFIIFIIVSSFQSFVASSFNIYQDDSKFLIKCHM